MKRLLILFIFGLCSGLAAFAQATLQPVAIVRLTRSEPITVGELRREMERRAWRILSAQAGRPPTQAEINNVVQNSSMSDRRQVLDIMITERLVIQAAERDRITVSDNEVNQQIQQLRAGMAQSAGRPPTDEEFAQVIREEMGIELPAFRDQIRRQALFQRYLMSQKQELLSNIQAPTEAEIVNFYNLSRAQIARPQTIRFSMINVPYGPDAASRTSARNTIDTLSREIGTNPARFDEVVIRGQSPNAGFLAGDGGYLPIGPEVQQALGADFVSVAFSLRQGEVSRVIEGRQGFHIIKVTETYEHRLLELDDIVQPGSRVTVRQYIGMNMANQRQQEALERATSELTTELRAGNPFQIMENNLNW